MSKLKHTPGSWKISGFDDQVESSNGDYICYDINNEFDAQLIAAAPEMLKELIESCKRSGLHQNIIEKATGLKIEEVIS